MISNKLRLKASSIIETVIAVTIISICSLIATLVFVNVIESTTPLKKYNVEYELDKIIEETLSEKAFYESTFKYKEFTIERRVQLDKPYPEVNTVIFLVTSGKTVYQYNLLVYKKD